MAVRTITTTDGFNGSYEKTRLGVTSYPNTRKVDNPRYLLATNTSPVYYDPSTGAVSPIFNHNSSICGDLYTLVSCPVSHKVYLVSFIFNSLDVATVTFYRLNDTDIRLALYNPRRASEVVTIDGVYTAVPISWSFTYKSRKPEIDSIPCCPVMAMPDLGSDTFYVFGNYMAYIVNPVEKTIDAEIDFSTVNGGRVEAFKFSPYYPTMLYSAVSARNQSSTYGFYVLDLIITPADLATYRTKYKDTGVVSWFPVPVFVDFGTHACSQYPSAYAPATTGWVWEMLSEGLSGSIYWLNITTWNPYTYTAYGGYGFETYKKAYVPNTSTPLLVPPDTSIWMYNQVGIGAAIGSYPKIWYVAAYWKAAVSYGWGVCGPATVGQHKVDFLVPEFHPVDPSAGVPYKPSEVYDSDDPKSPKYIPFMLDTATMPNCREIMTYGYKSTYKYKTIGEVPFTAGPQMDAIQPLCARAPGTLSPLVGSYSSDGGYLFLSIDSWTATVDGSCPDQRIGTLKDPLGNGQLVYGMAPIYDPAPAIPKPPT